jgi:hypothetical protein
MLSFEIKRRFLVQLSGLDRKAFLKNSLYSSFKQTQESRGKATSLNFSDQVAKVKGKNMRILNSLCIIYTKRSLFVLPK